MGRNSTELRHVYERECARCGATTYGDLQRLLLTDHGTPLRVQQSVSMANAQRLLIWLFWQP